MSGRKGKALRWIDGKGTCLAPCVILGVPLGKSALWLAVKFDDGVSAVVPAEYVSGE